MALTDGHTTGTDLQPSTGEASQSAGSGRNSQVREAFLEVYASRCISAGITGLTSISTGVHDNYLHCSAWAVKPLLSCSLIPITV